MVKNSIKNHFITIFILVLGMLVIGQNPALAAGDESMDVTITVNADGCVSDSATWAPAVVNPDETIDPGFTVNFSVDLNWLNGFDCVTQTSATPTGDIWASVYMDIPGWQGSTSCGENARCDALTTETAYLYVGVPADATPGTVAQGTIRVVWTP